MCDNEVIDYRKRKEDSRKAYLNRLSRYWNTPVAPRFNARIGEIFEVDFGENVGSEFSGRHLALCLANSNPTEDRVLVIPLTSKYERYNLQDVLKTECYVPGAIIKAGVAQNEVRYISKHRIFKTSTILKEDPLDKLIPVGRAEFTAEQLARFRRFDV